MELQAAQGDQLADPAKLKVGVLACIGRSQIEATLARVRDKIDSRCDLVHQRKVSLDRTLG